MQGAGRLGAWVTFFCVRIRMHIPPPFRIQSNTEQKCRAAVRLGETGRVKRSGSEPNFGLFEYFKPPRGRRNGE